jgi:predicted negative regulator of RcsB-dependent stress response
MPATGSAAIPPSLLDDPVESLPEWFRLHSRTLTIVLGAIVVIGGGIWLYVYATAQQSLRADSQLIQPERSLAAGNVPLAQTDLKRVITRFKGTAAAAQASLLLAQTYYDQQKYADGIATLNDVPRHGGAAPFAAAVESLTAIGYSDEGKNADAAHHFLKAAELTPFAAEKSQYRATAARTFAMAGDTASAVNLWTDIAKNDADPYTPEAHLRLGELTVKPAPKG